jgi:hypothetical protein
MAGYLTYHCKKCGAAIPHNDILEGLAHVLSNENAAICSECVRTPAGGTGEHAPLKPGPTVKQGGGVPIDQMETQDAAPVELIAPSARRPRSSARMAAVPAAPPASPRAVMFSLIAGGAMVLAAAIIFVTHRSSENKPSVTASNNEPEKRPASTATGTDTSTQTKKPDDAPKEAETPQFNSISPDAVQTVKETTLLKLNAEDFKGGTAVNNLWGKGRNARSVFGAKTKTPSMSASFDLKASPAGPATLLVDTIKHTTNDACHISISVNGHEVFQGADPSHGAGEEWAQYRFPVDARILHADRNEIRINNLENSGEDGPPYYIISGLEIRTQTE